MVEAQQWLKDNYENKKDNTAEIRIGGNIELEGKLTIDGYPNLKDIFLGGAKGITELSINNCPNVEVIFVSRNQITKIEGLTNLTKLQKLSFGNNRIEKIDISQNGQLGMLHFAKNPKNLDDDTFAITTLLKQASEADLKEIAGKLELNVDGKTPEEMKKLISDEIEKLNQNKEKLNEAFPNLISDKNAVDDKKVAEIKNNVAKGEEYQKLVEEAVNTPIVEADKIDQTKLTDELKKAANYEKLVADNKDLTTDDGKEMDQKKIDGLKTASGDATAAIPILGVDDLKPDTLNAILGGNKLSDIPKPETLKSILEKNKKLEDALNNIGINPNDADVGKKIAILKGLEERVIELYGEDYKEILKVQEYQNQVEIIGGKIELYDKDMEGVEELTGELLIENYANVEEINLERWDKRKRGGKLKGRITKITISNCPKVKELNLNNNEISEVILEGDFLNLERLELGWRIPPNLDLLFCEKPLDLMAESMGNERMLSKTYELENRPTTDYSGPLKEILGLNPADNLPDNWQGQLAKKDDLAAAQSPQDVAQELATANQDKDKLNDWQNRFPNKTPEAVANELNDLKDKPADQQKIDELIKLVEKQNQAIKKYGDKSEKFTDDDNTNFTDKTITQITNQDLIDKGITTPGGLTGPLKLVGFTKLKKIEINDRMSNAPDNLDNDLTELTIVNCPELEEIDVRSNKLTKLDIIRIKTDNGGDDGDPAPTDKLKNLTIGRNKDLEEVSLKYCPKLQEFLAGGNAKLVKI
ncbi:860_t:CDS:2 [Cetraspora pellucida]|uniref:860_t:CDS:1 n=1 Tax=Cetraspora pellucida TaxID=1433469 RepID=A0ACA9KMC9_9GLOM|nr:860_t:CDS:2 [Cetraspora pellucida]